LADDNDDLTPPAETVTGHLEVADIFAEEILLDYPDDFRGLTSK
jgi:hypothetical protein